MRIHHDQTQALAPLRVITTIDGATFDPSLLVWRLVGAIKPRKFDFLSIPFVTEELRIAIRDACASLLLSASPDRVWMILSSLRSFFKFSISQCHTSAPIENITLAGFMNYATSIPLRKRHKLARFRESLLSLRSVGFPHLQDDLVATLSELKIPEHDKGSAVSTMDPTKGPLTDLEYDALIAAIQDAFAQNQMNLADYVLIMLGITLGARPTQLAMVKVKDLQVGVKPSGDKFYVLRITRLKQGKGVRPRTYFRDRALAADFGAIVERQCKASRTWASERGLNEDEAPLFPSNHYFDRPSEYTSVAPRYEYHRGGAIIGERISRTLSKLRVVSERTGKPMRIFQARIRRTFGTRLAAEGYDLDVISELMDHSHSKSSHVYIETRPELIERVDRALALKMAPMAQAFLGTIVSDDEPSKRDKFAPGRVVHLSNAASLEALGGCGKRDYCGLAAPLACYTCTLFNPWVDGSHEALLELLITEREEQLQLADRRIATVNDRTILAVADVVNRCSTILSSEHK
ncbi:site-specific integrase [Microvirga tunisiensis]|uniref:Site-specific integrase n=1 Tax=Microvirga tunisiensis TaxID=2108360 RepID=A0A5N7MMJ9_9HYPH|nr:site-specific integrase [Microvirga tunisiensis]MPR12868.1 site-specific integrase [Microvirga tunisiensis]MPR28282.1 site-specific integrase [Microvirga tunisiensis]